MNTIAVTVTTLLGGLALFIYGMNLMSDGLQKAAGDKMKKVLEVLTRNPIMGLLAGALCTAVLQSSSATTVMVIGFVTSGLMKLPQAISVVMGANIGTTVTAQLIAFDIGDYAWVILFGGFIMYFFLKKYEKVSQIGEVIFAFGMLFVGINTMGNVMKPLASSPVFTHLMMQVQDMPGLGVLLGACMTLVVQSSSATIAVLQNLAATAGPDGVHSILGLTGAIPILFGDNIGTTITAVLASIGGSISAKRTACAHVIFNVTGTLIFIWFIPWIAKFITFISPKGAEVAVISRQIANTHMLFNVTNALIWLPLIWLMVKIVTKIIPGQDQELAHDQPIYLDRHVLDRPLFAIHLASRELVRLLGIAKDTLVQARKGFMKGEKSYYEKVRHNEEVINNLQQEITDYLASILSAEGATSSQTQSIAHLMHVASDVEHIGDHCINIVELAEERFKKKYIFSDTAIAEVYDCFDKAFHMVGDTQRALAEGNVRIAGDVLRAEDEMNKTEMRLRNSHMQRLNQNKCSPAFTVTYTETVHNLEKIGDSCRNIAEAVLDNQDSSEHWDSEPVEA